MTYHIATEQRANQNGLDGTIYVLSDASGAHQAEVWPAFGFNCYRWRTVVGAQPIEALYADPDMFNNGRPTRGGIPVLFPFPNRIRAGRFTWEGKEHQLPLNDSSGKNAIHGFASRKPWRIVDQGADAGSAWLTGEFRGSADAPESLALWPADYALRLTYRLLPGTLRIEAEVTNPDKSTLPFGLGFHPYFRVPLVDGLAEAQHLLESPADEYWELQDSLPTGTVHALDVDHDLTDGRPLNQLHLDDVFTGLPTDGMAELWRRGRLRAGNMALELWTAPDYRELVLFNPPHRRAVCLEPYTCPTDAVNLQARGIEAGWRALPPGGRWTGVVELVCRRTG